MKQTEISTAEIKDYLSISFTDVKPLIRIDMTPIVKAKDCRTISVRHIKGVEMSICAYNLGEDLDTCEYQRFVHFPAIARCYSF